MYLQTCSQQSGLQAGVLFLLLHRLVTWQPPIMMSPAKSRAGSKYQGPLWKKKSCINAKKVLGIILTNVDLKKKS